MYECVCILRMLVLNRRAMHGGCVKGPTQNKKTAKNHPTKNRPGRTDTLQVGVRRGQQQHRLLHSVPLRRGALVAPQGVPHSHIRRGGPSGHLYVGHPPHGRARH